MDETIRIGIRLARPADAGEIAHVYVDSWRDTYANILPETGLPAARDGHGLRNGFQAALAGSVAADENGEAVRKSERGAHVKIEFLRILGFSQVVDRLRVGDGLMF